MTKHYERGFQREFVENIKNQQNPSPKKRAGCRTVIIVIIVIIIFIIGYMLVEMN